MKDLHIFNEATDATPVEKAFVNSLVADIEGARQELVAPTAQYFIEYSKEKGITPVECMMALTKALRVMEDLMGVQITAHTEEEMKEAIADDLKNAGVTPN